MPNRVIVIAGASCVGKSTLIRQFQGGENRDAARTLGLKDPDMWIYANARHMPPACSDPGAAGLMLHYDIVRPVMERGVGSFAVDPGLAPALEAPQLTICTMWGDGALLQQRAALKRATRTRLDAAALCSPIQWWMRTQRMRTLLAWYSDDSFIAARYAQWFEFVGLSVGERPHWVLDARQREVKIIPAHHWQVDESAAHRFHAAGCSKRRRPCDAQATTPPDAGGVVV